MLNFYQNSDDFNLAEKYSVSNLVVVVLPIVTILLFGSLPIFVSIFYPIFRLGFGTLYPAYASYKVVKSRDVRSYVKWMMYWIVFAIFTSVETFTDILLSWFPFYYEVKILIVFWLLSPATNGSSFLYRKFVHPLLTYHEEEIDEYLSKIKENGYNAIINLGSRGLNFAANTLVQTAAKSREEITRHLIRSYSLDNISTNQMEPKIVGKDSNDGPVLRRSMRRIKSLETINEGDIVGHTDKTHLSKGTVGRVIGIRVVAEVIVNAKVINFHKMADEELERNVSLPDFDKLLKLSDSSDMVKSTSEYFDNRAGKYNKLRAPELPSKHVTKATLILRPNIEMYGHQTIVHAPNQQNFYQIFMVSEDID